MSRKSGYSVNRLGTIAAWLGKCTRSRAAIFADVNEERWRQEDKWGEQRHPDLNESDHRMSFQVMAEEYKRRNDYNAETDSCDWTDILLEEIYEALAESDPTKLREELVQSAAVITAWLEDLDSRDGN